MVTPVIQPKGCCKKNGHYYGPKDFETNGIRELPEHYSVDSFSEAYKGKLTDGSRSSYEKSSLT